MGIKIMEEMQKIMQGVFHYIVLVWLFGKMMIHEIKGEKI